VVFISDYWPTARRSKPSWCVRLNAVDCAFGDPPCEGHAESAAPNKTQFNGAGGSRAYIGSKRIGDQCHVDRIFDPARNGSN
jgi:hypothetical protein